MRRNGISISQYEKCLKENNPFSVRVQEFRDGEWVNKVGGGGDGDGEKGLVGDGDGDGDGDGEKGLDGDGDGDGEQGLGKCRLQLEPEITATCHHLLCSHIGLHQLCQKQHVTF